MSSTDGVGKRFAAYAAAIANSPTFPSTGALREPSTASGEPGIERLRANLRDIVPPPPAWYTLGFRLEDVDQGVVTFVFQPLAGHTNYAGTVHGGVLSALADSAMGCAILSALDEDHWCGTVDMNINFLRPVHVPGPLVRAVGRVHKRGGTTALVEASLTVESLEVVFATSTYLIRTQQRLPGQPASGA